MLRKFGTVRQNVLLSKLSEALLLLRSNASSLGEDPRIELTVMDEVYWSQTFDSYW